MKTRSIHGLLFLFVVCVAGTIGCSSGPRPPNTPVNAAKAREVLQTALESWKRGEKIDALQSASPAIYVIDSQWQAGAVLKDYRIVDDGKEMDALLHCPVVLTIRDQAGNVKEQQVTFYISTAPNLTVARKLF
jgi:hypothetical protein